jgi:hypothetical protein
MNEATGGIYFWKLDDTLLDATNLVNIASSGMFVAMVSTSPALQTLLVQ